MTAHRREGRLARVGLTLAAWSERWFPDPLVIALSGVVVVFILGILSEARASECDPEVHRDLARIKGADAKGTERGAVPVTGCRSGKDCVAEPS